MCTTYKFKNSTTDIFEENKELIFKSAHLSLAISFVQHICHSQTLNQVGYMQYLIRMAIC